jgi:tryptophan synthase alpha chain
MLRILHGVILPDMPLDVYRHEYKAIFDTYGMLNIFLITPQTSKERIQEIDSLSRGFIYLVSSASVTGSTLGISGEAEAYFERIQSMKLKNPIMIGFGIASKQSFDTVSRYGRGAIIGSAFIRVLGQGRDLEKDIHTFVQSIKES